MWRDTLVIWRRRVWRKIIRRFLAKIESVFRRKRSALLERTIQRFWRFGELYSVKSWSVIWRNHSVILEKTVRRLWRFGELYSAKSWSVIWRNRSVILEKTVRRLWRSLWCIVMLDDRTRRSKVNGEKMETNYGDQNFIHHKMESTYLERFKGRNV